MSLKKGLLGISIFFFLLYFATTISYAQQSTKGTVTTEILNLRSGPDTTYSIVKKLNKSNKLTILGSYEDWYVVKTDSGLFGWVIKEHISTKTATVSRGEDVSRTSEAPPSKSSELISFAKKFIGVNYVWGGESPDGFDCSGFVQYVYKHLGISLNRVACDQATEGTFINKNDLIPGDLVFFDTDGGNSYINHVGIYIGNGQFIQASSGHGEVMITDMTKGFYYNTYMTARRILN